MSDMQNIWHTIALENPYAATRLAKSIDDKIVLLARHPRIGVRRPDIKPATRQLVEGPYLIFYETHPDSDDDPIDRVEVVRIIDGRRDLMRLF